MIKATPNRATRQQILRAALKRFAHAGYAAASVQQIVADAKMSKPALYYYFKDKASLFQALVSEAHDERYRLMREAANKAAGLRAKLVEILSVLFEYFRANRELMRISLATAFASPGEMPRGLRYVEKCERNFEFIHSLIKQAQADGEVDNRFNSEELAFSFYGQTTIYLMAHLLMPEERLTRRTAERIVDLFLAGAAPRGKGEKHRRKTS